MLGLCPIRDHPKSPLDNLFYANNLVLQREKIRVSFQPTRTLQQEFPKPKDKLDTNRTRDFVYKIECSACDFTYYGQTNRALKTRIKEHKRAVEYNDKNSMIAQHVEQYDRNMDFENAGIVSREKNYRKRLFLEAWYSQMDKSSGNDHIDIPDVYGSLMHPN
jgi:ribosomal protein S20